MRLKIFFLACLFLLCFNSHCCLAEDKLFTKESKELKPGIIQHLIRSENKRGPVIAHILEIDLNNEKVSVAVGLPDKKKLTAKDTLSNIVKQNMAFLGINANYFDIKAQNPIGVLITEGKWLVGPVYDRAALGVTKDKKVTIDKVTLAGEITILRGLFKKQLNMINLDGLNTPPHLIKSFGIINSKWNKELVLPDKNIVAVAEGKKNCVKKIMNGNVIIPKDGFILVANNNINLNDYVKKRDCLKINFKSSPVWSDVVEAVGGGPYLVKDGKVFVDEKEENFKFAPKNTYAARSAGGVDSYGKLYLIAVDGRRKGIPVGLSLKELAELLVKFHLKDAINLDGGSSSTLIADGKIINELSEHHERKITSGLLIFYKK